MSRVVRIAVLTLILAVAVGFGIRKWKDPEVAVLDESTRAGVPGEFVKLSDGVTHYEAAGPDSGRVVVLVHGFSVPAYIWDSTFQALRADGYRVIRYDLFGRGWSDRPDVAYDGAMYDRQLDELLDSLHVVGPIDLAGLSFGGFVTAHYTGTHPQRVQTLVLLDPVASGAPLPAMLRAPVLGPWIWQVMRVPGMAEGQASDFLHPEHFPGWAELYRPQMRFKGFGRSLLRSAGVMGNTNFDSLYAGVARTGVPVLLIWGKQDQTVQIEKAQVIQTAIPSVEFFPVDSAGHLPATEQAAVVRERWRAFYQAHPMR
jgi:pimeloyl-ACP methyl ester carboxylesterase